MTGTIPRFPGRASHLGRALALLGGMDPDRVDGQPAQRRDYGQRALLLLLAALAGGMAVALGADLVWPDLPGWAVVLSGIVGGLVVLVVQRALVLAVSRSRSIVAAIVPIMIACTLGVVLSVPVPLRIFESEIAATMTERLAEDAARLSPLTSQLVEAKAEVARLQEALMEARIGMSPATTEALRRRVLP